MTQFRFSVLVAAAVLCGGCATVNSERTEVRLAAVRAISDQDELYAVLDETSFADARAEAVHLLSREDLLVRAARRGNLPEGVRKDAVRRIRSEDELLKIVQSEEFGEALRQMALDGIAEESRLCTVAMNETVPLALRQTALNGIAEESRLCTVAINETVPLALRQTAANRVTDPDNLLHLFLDSTDALPALHAVCARTLPPSVFRTKEGRARALSLLDGLSAGDETALVLPLLDGDESLATPARQMRIADTLLAVDSPALRRFAEDNLFDSEAVERIAAEGPDDLSVWALSLRPGEDAAARIAAGAKSVAAQCRALSLVGSRTKIEDIARHGRSRAVRLAAVDRLDKDSRDVLAALAEDADAAVRTRALARLQNAAEINDEEIGLLKERDAERRKQTERERAEAERKAVAAEREAEKEFLRKALDTLGSSQIEAFRRYVAVREKQGLRGEQTFAFTGRIEEIARGTGSGVLDSRRRVVLAVRDEAGRRFPVTIDLSASLSPSIGVGDVATFAGTFRSGDSNQARLVRGVLRSTGLPE